MKKTKPYESKAKITVISATSRAAIKMNDNFFTIEYHEERTIPDIDGVQMDRERELLWDAVNGEVDNQVEEVVNAFKNRNKK